MARYLLRNTRARLVITKDDITFTRQQGSNGKAAGAKQVIHRVDGSTLSFRVAANGPVGSQYTGYVLKLCDKATGHEVYAGAFGRGKVQQACESQGWSFDAAGIPKQVGEQKAGIRHDGLKRPPLELAAAC